MISVRNASNFDSKEIFNWRNDKQTINMSINPSPISIEQHREWFKRSLCSSHITMVIGEFENKRIGVCRFDLNYCQSEALVSINLNPKYRGKGFGKQFLIEAIKFFDSALLLKARVKNTNLASIKIFEKAGFRCVSSKDNIMEFQMKPRQIEFRKVQNSDSEVLYDLLKSRIYQISHRELPSFEKHVQFVKKNPYKHWYLIIKKPITIGAFYIKKDNSIGLDLLEYNKVYIKKVLDFISKNFVPNESIPSAVPKYFYINAAIENIELQEALKDLKHDPLQISYQLNF